MTMPDKNRSGKPEKRADAAKKMSPGAKIAHPGLMEGMNAEEHPDKKQK
jgi:hypothetical protein